VCREQTTSVESYLTRVEMLLAANWGTALRGDPRSLDQCRRMLDSMARVQGLVPSWAERVLPERIRAMTTAATSSPRGASGLSSPGTPGSGKRTRRIRSGCGVLVLVFGRRVHRNETDNDFVTVAAACDLIS
jgi:hypothetical protein